MRKRPLFVVLMLVPLVVGPRQAAADHVFVTTSDGLVGNCAALAIDSPWSITTGLEPIGPFATVRHFDGLHWIVNGSPFGAESSTDDVQAIDPVTFETVRRFSVGAGSNPRDIAIVDPGHAWVSRYDSRWLLEVDPTTGAALDSIDLGLFADADGLPEMAWMALDGEHLFVQIQRIDRAGSGATVPPALLAVIDVTSKQLVDVDPDRPDVQAIELLGPEPQTKMQIDGRRLYISTPGKLLDVEGGIEEIDLDTFDHLGFLISEEEWSIDMGAFVLVSSTRGYVINHTDFTLSSHLDSFDRPSGGFLEEHFVSFSMIESVVHDPFTDQLFLPDPEAGVRIFHGSSGGMLAGPIATGLPPRDLILFRSGPPTDAKPALATPSLSVTPNPFRHATWITLTVLNGQPVAVTIHDVRGRLVRRITTASPAATVSLVWDGRDDAGTEVPPGVYVVALPAGGSGAPQSRRVVRVR